MKKVTLKSGIYKIINKVNNKFYIGSSINIEKRIKRHFIDLNKNEHGNSYLQRSFNKYGEFNFSYEILELCEPNDIFKIEQTYLDIYFKDKNCYNLRNNVNDLTNVSQKYRDNQKATWIEPILQYNIAGELVGMYKNIMHINTKIFSNVYTTLKNNSYCRGYKFVYAKDYLNVFERVNINNEYFNCDIPIENTKQGKVRKTGVAQICPETREILNTFSSTKQVQKYFNFYNGIINKACKEKIKVYGYYWEYTDKIINNIKTNIKKHKSRTINHLHKIKLTKIDTGEEMIYNTITEACRDLGIEDSARTKFTRVLNGFRKSTRGYKVEYENNK